MKISDLAELKVTINQLKRKARRERAKARKQEHKERMDAYKLAMQAEPERDSREHVKIFRDAMQARSAKKFRNNVSSQQAGTIKPYTAIVRSGFSAITVKTTRVY